MTYPAALIAAQDLRGHLLAAGVQAVSIELVMGRGEGGWHDDRWIGTLGHHIVSRRTQGNTPGLKLVKVGRTDLVGPLCNGYGGFDEIARIICMGWANHPGAGGPAIFPSGIIPANNGRPYLFGWEFEGGIIESDFTPSYRIFMGRCLAGTLNWRRLDERSHFDHKHWAPGRKVDRLGYTLAQARAEIKPWINGTSGGNQTDNGEDDMTSAEFAGQLNAPKVGAICQAKVAGTWVIAPGNGDRAKETAYWVAKLPDPNDPEWANFQRAVIAAGQVQAVLGGGSGGGVGGPLAISLTGQATPI